MKKILIIEDNIDIAGLLNDLFKQNGYAAVMCHDGYQGIEFTHREKPDLILLDMMLPAGGGLYVLEKLKVSTLTKAIPIVVLTASRDMQHKQAAIDMGVDAYLEKPFDADQLLATVQGFVG